MTNNTHPYTDIVTRQYPYGNLNPRRFDISNDEWVKFTRLISDFGFSEHDLENVIGHAHLQAEIDAQRVTPLNEFETYMNQLRENTPKINYDRLEKAFHDYFKPQEFFPVSQAPSNK